MKIEVSKEWCMNMAQLEGDSEVGAGVTPPDAAWAVIQKLSENWCDAPCLVRAGCGCADAIEQALNAERETCADLIRARRNLTV